MPNLSQQQQMSKISHLQPSLEAADRVRACHAYISLEPIDEGVVVAQRQQIAKFFLYCGDHSDQTGTSAAIFWNPSFKYLRAIHIQPRDPDSTRRPKLVLLFSHYDEMKHKIFTCYHDSNQSLAKIILSKSEDSYPCNTCGFIGINSINSRDGYYERSDFRYGSFLIQLAIEYSFQQGYEGRVDLFSTNGSSKFYFKLGFLPTYLTQSILNELQTSSNVDGFNMYLPQASIDAWKERILACPIILSQQEIDLLITNPKNAKQRNLNKRLEALLDSDGFDTEHLVFLLNEGAKINAVPNGYKALHTLIRHNHARNNDALIEMLVKVNHANINIKDPITGRTPLHALIHGRPDTGVAFIRWLVFLGADIHTRDKDGQTLLQAAHHTKNSEVIEYLKPRSNRHRSVSHEMRCSSSMQIISGFMVVLGVAAVAVAFTMLNAATFGTVGVTVACIGIVALLTGCGFFKKSCEHGQTIASFQPII